MSVDDVLRDALTLGASSSDAADWSLGRRAIARYVRRHAHSTLELNNTYRGEAAESVVAEATEIVIDDTDTWAEIDGMRGPIRVQIKCSGRYQRWRDDTTRVSWTVYGKRPYRDGRPVEVLPTPFDVLVLVCHEGRTIDTGWKFAVVSAELFRSVDQGAWSEATLEAVGVGYVGADELDAAIVEAAGQRRAAQ